MKSYVGAFAATAFVLAQLGPSPAFAQDSQTIAAPYRVPAAQTFSAADLQRYGLSPEAADRAMALQAEGYQVQVLSEAEAASYRAGVTDTQWLLLGILAGVIVIAVAVD